MQYMAYLLNVANEVCHHTIKTCLESGHCSSFVGEARHIFRHVYITMYA